MLGSRQAGKTTLAKTIAGDKDYLYLDLENPVDLEKLAEAREYLGAQRNRLIALDEVQRVPDLFVILQGLGISRRAEDLS